MSSHEYTFVITIVLMGLATFAIGLLPDFASIGIAAPVAFVALRMLQGLAMGGEYGGAVTYVAEHAPNRRRGSWTSWIQTTGSLALLLSLGVILLLRYTLGEAAFSDYIVRHRQKQLVEGWCELSEHRRAAWYGSSDQSRLEYCRSL